MEKIGLTKHVFVLGLVAAVLLSAIISAGVSSKLFVSPQVIKGEKGAQGPQGIAGQQGLTGATGSQGPPGTVGPAGPQGAVGAIGPVGPQGPKGDTGSAGAVGPAGLQGPYLPDYDSGWMDISNKNGEFLKVPHNLNNLDVIVEIYGKTVANGGAHQKYLGLTGFLPGWNRTFGGNGSDTAIAVVPAIDGGCVVAGTTPGVGAGNTDVWLFKTDSEGAILWNRTYGGTKAENTQSMVATSDGGFVIAAATQSFGGGGRDFWLLKVDSNGVLQWNKTYGTALDEQPLNVIQTSDDGYAVSGGVSAKYFSSGTPPVSTWLIKTNSAGEIQWNKTLGEETYGNYTIGGAGVMSFTIVQTGDGGFALGSAGTFDLTGFGGHDYVLTKLDAQGNVQWFKTYGGQAGDIERALIATKDNGFAMVGYTQSFGAGAIDIWMVKTNSSGAMLWNKTYGGALNDMVGQNMFSQTADGGFAIAGYTGTYGAGSNDMWLLKTDSYGNLQWSKTYGGTGNDLASAITLTKDGSFIMVGYTNSFGMGANDVYLVKVATEGESGLAWIDSTVNTVTLYKGANDVYWNYVRVRIWKID